MESLNSKLGSVRSGMWNRSFISSVIIFSDIISRLVIQHSREGGHVVKVLILQLRWMGGTGPLGVIACFFVCFYQNNIFLSAAVSRCLMKEWEII